MTDGQTNKPRMTCATWFALAVFGVLGVFALFMFNTVQTVQDNRARRVQEVFDLLGDNNGDEAFDLIASEWQTTLESADGLVRTFADIPVTDIRLDGRMSTCYTHATYRGDQRILSNDSQRYEYLEGSATVNGIPDTYIYVRLTTERLETKLLGIELDETDYGAKIPYGCD